MEKSRMSILKLELKVGEGVSLGDHSFIRVESKTGRSVRLAIIALRTMQIKLIPSGVMPRPFAIGIQQPAMRSQILEAQASAS